MQYLPYNPDLAPLEFHLLGLLLNFLEGKCFAEDLKKTVQEYFDQLDKYLCHQKMFKLLPRWDK